MDHILNRSNKKKVFFENEKVKTFDKNTVIFGKSPQVDQQANKMQGNLFTLAGHHERTVSNTQETSLFFEAQSGGSSPKLKIKNYAENLLKAAEMYKDPGSVDSTVYDSPNKKKQKDTSKLDKSVAETKLGLVPVLSEPSVVSEILPNNRELLHGSQQPSLIESIQKIQKEHHKLTQKTRNHDMSGRYAQSNRHNASSNGGSRENTFDEQAGDLESAENHPIYEAIRIEEEETRNKQQRKLGPRTKLLDHVNQVLIQSMFTEKQQIRMQKKNKTYKPEIQRKSQISEISWGDPLPPAVSFHVGSSLNNYSSTIVKDIKKLVQSTDMSAIQNSVQSGPEHLESEISSVTAQLRNLQKSSDLMKVLDLSKVDGGGFDKDIRKVPNYPKLYARDQRVSIMPKKETSTFQSGAELLQQISPSHPKFDLSSKRDNQPHKYQVVGNRSQPTLPQWVSEENSGSLAERGSSMIVGEIVGLSAIYSQTRNPLEPEKPREFRRGKTHSTVPLQSLETHGKISDHLSFIERASQAPFSDRTRSFAKPTSDYPARHPVLEFREGQSFKKLPVQNKEPSTERGKRSSPSMIGNIMRIPGMNPNPAERKSSPSKSDKSLDGQPPFPSPKKKGYKISSSSKGYSSHRKLLHRPTFKHAEEFTRIHPPLQLGPDTMVSAHGILDGPVQQSLQLRFNKAAKAQQMQPIKVTELLPRMKQMLRDSVELLASKPQQLIL